MKYRFLLLFVFGLSIVNAQYTTPNDGGTYTIQDIADASPTTVVHTDSNTYEVMADITIAETDSFVITETTTIAFDSSVLLTVLGTVNWDAEATEITSIDPEHPHQGIRLEEGSIAYFNNIMFNYGGGIKVLTENFEMNNCTVQYQSKGASTGGAVSFSRGAPVVQNSTFRLNDMPAISSGANQLVQASLLNNLIEYNSQSNENRPQINMGPSGEADSLRIIGNTINGDRDLNMVGGIAVGNFFGEVNKVLIKDNLVSDNRYGMTLVGGAEASILNNVFEYNDSQNIPNNGGSGISLYAAEGTDMNVIVANNQIRNNLWGITLIQGAFANLGDGTDLSPGGNVFADNGNGGVVYALYNNTPLAVEAQNNCWIEGQESTAEQVEEVIVHQVDDANLGLVNYTPFNCKPVSISETGNHLDLEISPNPSQGAFKVVSEESIHATVFTFSGKKIDSFEIVKGENIIQTNYSAGVYFVLFENETTHFFSKLLIE